MRAHMFVSIWVAPGIEPTILALQAPCSTNWAIPLQTNKCQVVLPMPSRTEPLTHTPLSWHRNSDTNHNKHRPAMVARWNSLAITDKIFILIFSAMGGSYLRALYGFLDSARRRNGKDWGNIGSGFMQCRNLFFLKNVMLIFPFLLVTLYILLVWTWTGGRLGVCPK